MPDPLRSRDVGITYTKAIFHKNIGFLQMLPVPLRSRDVEIPLRKQYFTKKKLDFCRCSPAAPLRSRDVRITVNYKNISQKNLISTIFKDD
jgi:hypothetical protein